MVEKGIIKIFFGSNSKNKTRGGFIRVIDDYGQPTGEEVFFHLNQAHRVMIHRQSPEEAFRVMFSASKATLDELQGEPQKGDKVVFEATSAAPNRRVTHWTLKEIWDDEELYLDEANSAEFEFEQEECPDGCGQTVMTCTCAELASFRSHNSMTDGYWTP